MSFLKQLLTPFIEFDENKKKEGVKQTQDSPPILPKAEPPVPKEYEHARHPLITGGSINASTEKELVTYSQNGTIAGPLPEHVTYFENLIEQANIKDPLFQGADFKEFVESKIDIDDITDETIKYQTAFNVLKSSGLTREKLLSTGREYLNLIGRDLNAFQSAHTHQFKKELGQKEMLVQKKAEELQALTQRLIVLKGEINNLTQDINLAKDKLNITRNSFLLAGENKQNQIQAELDKIAHYFR